MSDMKSMNNMLRWYMVSDQHIPRETYG